jgi:hypothetical protein
MKDKCNVLILESQKGFSEKIREYLQSRGTSSHIVTSFDEVGKNLRSLVMPVILAQIPEGKEAADTFLTQCTEVNNMFSYPLIAVGADARDHEGLLNKHFKLAISFNMPVNNAEISEALIYIKDSFEFPVPGNQIAPPKRATETEFASIDETLPASEIYSSFHSIPNLFFEELNKYNLLSKDFNGKKYVMFTLDDASNSSEYLSTDRDINRAFNEIVEKLPKDILTRIHRVAYLCSQIINHISSDPALIEHSKAAAMLFNWSLVNEQKLFLKKDYISLKSKAFRKELCSKVKDSAMKCALELSKTKVAEIISKIGKYIGLEEPVSDSPAALAASAIAAVDMVDRSCWQNNHFNPRAAYKIMVKAKSGELSEFHPIVLCCIIKVLSEALASNIRVFLIPRKLRTDPELMAAAKKVREQEVQAGERKVEINELTPGMRLSRPLIAFDGREILEQDMVLDQDLIWRIWQLSMVRALNAPLVVEN